MNKKVMKYFVLILTTIAFAIVGMSAQAQEDAAARSLLDGVSKKVRGQSFLHVSFDYSIENPKTGLPKNTINGTLYLSGSKYRVELLDNIQISNGERIWRILPADEVVETMRAQTDEGDGISPEKMLTMHEEGFNLRMMESAALNGIRAKVVRMYPTDVKNAVYTYIDVFVNEGKKELMRIVEYGKNGTVTTYELHTYHPSSTPKNGMFSFDANAYPDYELIDLDF
jgi:hypothetical protein